MSDATEKSEKIVSLDQIIAALPEAVHFSAKTTNSNAAASGVRIDQRFALNIPYVCARGLLYEQRPIPLDYTANSGSTATIFKALKTAIVLPEKPTDTELANAPKIAQLLQDHALEAATIGGETVDIRSRQILIPRADGSYVSITPLTSAGLCHYVNQAVDVINDGVKTSQKTKVPKTTKSESAQPMQGDLLEEPATAEPAPFATTHHRLSTAQMGIGGSNPQNVGSWVREMQRPIYVSAPRNQASLREALAIFYKGLDWSISTDVMFEYSKQLNRALFLGQAKGLDAGIKAQKMTAREREQQIFRRMAAYVMAQGDEAFDTLQLHASQLPRLRTEPEGHGKSVWVSDSVRELDRILIDADYRQRYRDYWPLELAKAIAWKVREYQKNENGQVYKLTDLSNESTGFLVRGFVEALEELHLPSAGKQGQLK